MIVIFLTCVVVLTAVAAVCDARIKKLPNVLTVPAFLTAIVFSLISGAYQAGQAGDSVFAGAASAA